MSSGTSPMSTTPHPNTLLLHQLRNGELPPDTAATLRAHIDACPQCSARWMAQQQHREAFVLAPVPPAIRAIAKPAPSRARWLAWLTPLLAVAAALLIVPRVMEQDPAQDEVRIKGAAVVLEAWLDTPQGPRLLREGDSVAEGDRIQLRFDAGEHPFVTLAGRDSTGVVEVYTTVQAEGGVELAPFALTLDNTPGEQAFFAVFSDSRLPQSQIESAVRGQVPVPEGTLRALHLRKR